MTSSKRNENGWYRTRTWGKGREAQAAAAAKSLQSCPTLCDSIDGSPPGSSIHGIFQARVLEWGAIAFSGETQEEGDICIIRLIFIVVHQKPKQHCEAIFLWLKFFFLIKKKWTRINRTMLKLIRIIYWLWWAILEKEGTPSCIVEMMYSLAPMGSVIQSKDNLVYTFLSSFFSRDMPNVQWADRSKWKMSLERL